jgi:hypothetical protein
MRSDPSRVRADLTSWILTGAAIAAYLWFIHESRDWLPALRQFLHWILGPNIIGRVPGAPPGWPIALGATVILLVVGGLISLAVYPRSEFDGAFPKLLALSALFGLSAAGWATQIAAIIGMMTGPIILALLSVIGGVAGVIARTRSGSLFSIVRSSALVRPLTPPSRWETLLHRCLLLFVLGVSSLAFLHAYAFPISEWDALVYHAQTAKLWYLHRPAPPVIAGPSVGIEMSYNYPSLFPGVGAFYYLLTGGVHDVYLRMVAPSFGVVTLVLAFYAADRIAGYRAGYFAVALLASTPLFFMYEVWPTYYAPLMALTLVFVYTLTAAWETGRKEYFVATTVVVGLIGNVTYWFVLPLLFYVGLLVLLTVRRFIRTPFLIGLGGLVFLLAAPVYLRNWLVLRDPVFPLGYKVFDSPYIPDATVLEDSLAEIRNNALGLWPGSKGFALLGRQIRTLLLDKNLLPIGWLGAIGLLFSPRSVQRAAWAYAVWATYVALMLLLQGWYWLRTLVLIIPALAVLGGVFLAGLMANPTHGAASVALPAIARVARRVAVGGLCLAILVFPGLTLAWAGPNQWTWTTSLGRRADYSSAWRFIGDAEGWLRKVYGGDYDAWMWLNKQLAPGERYASLDHREYYTRGGTNFPLDGLESTALVSLQDPVAIVAFLTQRKVRYILAPAWTEYGPSKFPLIRRLPIYRYLGTESFPLVAIFATPETGNFTRIYAVGPSPAVAQVQLLGAIRRKSMTVFPVGSENGRILIAMPVQGTYILSVEYLDNARVPIDLNYIAEWDPVKWAPLATLDRHGEGGWIHRRFVLSGLGNLLVLGPYARGSDAVIRRIGITPLGEKRLGLLRNGDVIILGGGGRSEFEVPIDPSFVPASARILLRIPIGGGTKAFTARAGGHPISVELWEGIVRERTDWWTKHRGLGRAPALPQWGTSAPVLTWDVQEGVYTLMVVAWGSGPPPKRVTIQVLDAVERR